MDERLSAEASSAAVSSCEASSIVGSSAEVSSCEASSDEVAAEEESRPFHDVTKGTMIHSNSAA